ncbi:MAG TPA: hypothetical protein VHR17_09135 [Thermoanaerobaculia bacterium]|nr:hypothetical protein [Thermoanaerobaculia bacterium]
MRLARLALLACLAGPSADARAQVLPLGGEFQVNLHTVAGQGLPSLDVDADGDFVVVWQSYGQDGDYQGVFARRFDSAGVPNGLVFQVNAFTSGWQSNAAVALDSSGDFVVVWLSFLDGGTTDVFARRFNAAGVPQAAEFRVNTFTDGHQKQPVLDLDADGDFVIAWQSPGQDGSGAGVFARRFNSAGIAQASEFQANSYVTGYQAYPAVGLDPDGDFVVAWGSQQDGSSFGVFGRRWSSSGAPQGGEFQINVYTPNHQFISSVDLSASGNFVVTWASNTQDGSDYGIFARRFSSSGTALGGELQVNAFTSSKQSQAVVSMEGDGDFVVTWWSESQDGSATGIFARRFGANGAPKTSELQVNKHTIGDQTSPRVALDGAGDFVVAWQSMNQDGDANGVFARRFSSLTLDIDGDGTAAPLTDGLLLLRHYFGFSGSTLTSGAVGGSCTRCTADVIQPFLVSAIAPQGPALRAGREFQVSSFTMNSQNSPAVSMSDDGAFVVVWGDVDNDGQGIFGRRFDADGSFLGVQFSVNRLTTGNQWVPDVSRDANGSFVVVWRQTAFNRSDVKARRFDAAGVTQDFVDFYAKVGEEGESSYGAPAIASLSFDHFVVTWTGSGGFTDTGVFGHRGVLGPEVQINTYTGSQANADVAMDGDGDFVVVWESSGQEGQPGADGIFGRRFNAAGAAFGNEFQVNSYTPDFQRYPKVAVNSSGAFVVVWDDLGVGGNTQKIFARRFNAAGAFEGSQFQVNSSSGGFHHEPDVAMSDDGGFVVAWDRDGDVFARWFAASGIPQGEDIQVNTYTAGAQFDLAVATDPNGDVVVVWDSFGQDGSYGGIFAQRFAERSPFDVDGDGTLAPLTDGLLVLRYLFGFTGATLISGAVDPDCTRCTAPAIEAYIQSLI